MSKRNRKPLYVRLKTVRGLPIRKRKLGVALPTNAVLDALVHQLGHSDMDTSKFMTAATEWLDLDDAALVHRIRAECDPVELFGQDEIDGLADTTDALDLQSLLAALVYADTPEAMRLALRDARHALLDRQVYGGTAPQMRLDG